ncbi:IclR family transcriptional regulator [Sphingomonas naphthae]|uniref:IclR family transcriptional regulator n=1 Tax=Sphingomonas naphthae TaxID=1813468 RepID=A0ABY7TH63_9SPHN|nr:IclR family transcriptional regulator [Sphingomonas naphthae]WCT72203.1 IclR family transcriptional regulator [Sphingomonas naphthae]
METIDSSLGRALGLFKAVVADRGSSSLRTLAHRQGVPLSTAQRWLIPFEREGLLVQAGRGRRVAGLALRAMAGQGDDIATIRSVALPLMRRFARERRTSIHLGVWDGDMVLYIAKAHGGGPRLFTREGMRLEGYCSAIGKVLLGGLPDAALDAYLADGSFIPLTERTITSPASLRRELMHAREQGFAADDREIQDDLVCHAVPIRDAAGTIRAALSVSRMTNRPTPEQHPTEALAEIAERIAGRVFRA